jgi:hypothetical protein
MMTSCFLQNAAESSTVGRWNSETLPFCEGVRSACVLNVTWFFAEAHFHFDGYVARKMSELWPQRIQVLPLSSHCIQKELQYGKSMPYRGLEYSVPMFNSVRCPMPDGIWQSNKFSLVPDVTRTVSYVYVACFMTSTRRQSCRTDILRYVRKEFHGHQPHWT